MTSTVPFRMMFFILVLHVWFIQYVSPRKTYYQKHFKYFKHSRRSLASDDSGFLNIDSGAAEDYQDDLGRYFVTDRAYIDTGEVHPISSETRNVWPFFKNLRSFPNGTRNCYTVRTKEGKNVNYLITAFFYYGNYDGKNSYPVFDLHIGVTRLRTINTEQISFSDVVYFTTADSIDVCLVNINRGTPILSALQLRPLVTNSLYQTSPAKLLGLVNRYDCGATPFSNTMLFRYKDDVYDRVWEQNLPVNNTISSWTSTRSDFSIVYSEQPAATVLKTFVQPIQGYSGMTYTFSNIAKPTSEFSVYLYFAGTLQSSSQDQRRFTVTINGNRQGPFNSPEYMKTLNVYQNTSVRGNVQISIQATTDSKYTPILNALEIFVVIPLEESPSNPEDVTAMMKIKQTYGITEDSWQGDPCVPTNFSWSRLGCNSDNPPRIVSLNLSSSELMGDIIASLSNLKSLRVLDLSHNNLTGSIPDSLAELSSLEVLNLAGNKLEGSVPKSLLEKSQTGALNLSLYENPKLCYLNPCKHKKNKAITFAAVAVSTLLVAMVILIVCYRKSIWQKVISGFKEKWFCNSGIRRFTYEDLKTITNKFDNKKCLGEGGFGKVYLGEVKNGTQVTQVAVKLRSQKSTQGAKEFQNEVNNLMNVHHRNLVSLIGYCNDGDNMAVIYEYMAKGNLKQHISPDAVEVLDSWEKRLQIAVEVALGLKYLHEDRKTPIVHRDLKLSNILLSEKLEAKIADFGLSKAFSAETTTAEQRSDPSGPISVGYLDPEFGKTRQLDKKSDIYSFGVILLELITGKEAWIKASDNNSSIHLSELVTSLKELEEIIDSRMQGTYKTNSVWKTVNTAMTCIQKSPKDRKDMKWVLKELEEALNMEIGNCEGTTQSNSIDNSKAIVTSRPMGHETASERARTN
ncbi:Mitogen-activated protein kinase kinase kinase [Parasponia andersonii]|uniref:non-specific serine/threonine protein kinase n=1 Tax=Parasponia andersonii TaxID=3476 RepID=A0A2P5AKG1_PARAD|nr:Mitogen-activated protein kinase kinase kinase [Parasponia andersonii]